MLDDREFNITLQTDEISSEIQLRFYSNTQVELQIRDIKAFSKDKKYIILLHMHINLSDDFKIVPLGIKLKEYRTITFIVKNMTYKKQYAVSIPLNGDEIMYTQMLYEKI